MPSDHKNKLRKMKSDNVHKLVMRGYKTTVVRGLQDHVRGYKTTHFVFGRRADRTCFFLL